MLAAWFAIIVGLAMIGQWMFSYASGQIPELKTETIRIGFHIAGEILTAIMLVISGVGLLFAVPWAPTLFYISMGMLLYTAIVSPGYFAQKGEWIWVPFFAVIIILAVLSVLAVMSMPG